MKASFASMKKRYCQKLGEQVLWDDGDASVPVCAPGQLCVRCTWRCAQSTFKVWCSLGTSRPDAPARAQVHGHGIGPREAAREGMWLRRAHLRAAGRCCAVLTSSMHGGQPAITRRPMSSPSQRRRTRAHATHAPRKGGEIHTTSSTAREISSEKT